MTQRDGMRREGRGVQDGKHMYTHGGFKSICNIGHQSKDCSTHLCLFCSLAYRVIVTIFLNSIYMH